MSGLDKNRNRNQTICFRMSPAERLELEARIQASCMPKGRFFIEMLLHGEIRIDVGKYQSDRLSLEIRWLRECLEDMSVTDVEACTHVLEECKALLEVVVKLSVRNDKRTAEDFTIENSKGGFLKAFAVLRP